MKIKLSLLTLMLGCAVQLNVYGQQSNTLLKRDFWRSQPSIKEIKQKIKEGSSPTELTSSMFDATVYAILENNSLKTVKYLIGQGNDINKITHDARTYLFWAAYKGNTELMNHLLNEGARTDLVDQHGYSVLMFAASTGQTNKEVYEICAANGMEIKTQMDRNGRNALLAFAGRKADFEMIEYFKSQGLDLYSKDKNGNGIFHHAALTGNVDYLKGLVTKYKVDYSRNEETMQNAFHFATRRSIGDNDPSPMPLYQYLESLGLDPGLTTTDGQNVLHNLAVRANDTKVFNYFISKGANPAKIDEDGNNPLINASTRGSADKIAFFARFSHDINHKNKEGFSAMTRALKFNSTEVVKLLESHGATINLKDKKGYDLGYHLVDATRQDLDVFDQKMKFLISKGYDPTATQKDNSTLLHAAIGRKNIKLIERLLDLGVSINGKDDSGQTVLHHAAMQAENEEILKFLLSKGADKGILTEFEESAYDLAKENELLSAGNVNIDFLKPVGR